MLLKKDKLACLINFKMNGMIEMNQIKNQRNSKTMNNQSSHSIKQNKNNHKDKIQIRIMMMIAFQNQPALTNNKKVKLIINCNRSNKMDNQELY